MDLLFAFEGSGQQGGLMAQLMPFILILFIVYFLMIRPQMKRQKEKKNIPRELLLNSKKLAKDVPEPYLLINQFGEIIITIFELSRYFLAEYNCVNIEKH